MNDTDWSLYLLQVLGIGEPFGFFDEQGLGVSLERGSLSPFSNTNIIRVSVLLGKAVKTVIDFHYPAEAYTYLTLNYPIKSAKTITNTTEPPVIATQEKALIFM